MQNNNTVVIRHAKVKPFADIQSLQRQHFLLKTLLDWLGTKPTTRLAQYYDAQCPESTRHNSCSSLLSLLPVLFQWIHYDGNTSNKTR